MNCSLAPTDDNKKQLAGNNYFASKWYTIYLFLWLSFKEMAKFSIIWVYLYKEVSVSKVGETLNLWIYIHLCIGRHIPILLDLLTWSFFFNYFMCILSIHLCFMTMFRLIYSPGFLYCLNFLAEVFFFVVLYIFRVTSFFSAVFPLLCCLGFLKSMTLPMFYNSWSVFFFKTITLSLVILSVCCTRVDESKKEDKMY